MAEQSACVRGEPAEPEPAHSSSADTKPKSIKKPTGWNFFFQSVAVSLFCISQNIPAFLARIKRLFEQSHMLLFPRFLYLSTARSQGTTWERGRNWAGFQSGWQYEKEIADRETKGWKWTSNIANVYQYPAPFHDQWVSLQIYVNMKAIFTVMNTNWAVVKIMPKKKNQACTGFEPMTSAIPVLRSTNWANKLNGR